MRVEGSGFISFRIWVQGLGYEIALGLCSYVPFFRCSWVKEAGIWEYVSSVLWANLATKFP